MAPRLSPRLTRLVLLAQLPGLLAASALLVMEYREQHQRITGRLVPHAREIVAAAGERLQGVEAELQKLGADVPSSAGEVPDFERRALLASHRTGAEAIVLATPRGDALLVAGAGQPPDAASVFTPAMLEAVIAGTPVYDTLGPDLFSRSWNTHVAVPVMRDARVEYTLVARLPPDGLQPLLQAARLPRGAAAALMDNRGRIVARTPGGQGAATFPDLSQLQEAARRHDTGVIERIRLEGVPSLAGYAHEPASGWISVVGVPRSALYAALWQPLAYALLPFLLLLPLLMAASRRLAWQLQRAATAPAAAAAPPAGLAPAPRRDIQRALLKEAEGRQAAIARELHDAVGSSLAGVSLLLGTARSFTSEPEALALIGTSQDQVAKITQQIRQISRGIMPAGQERGALLPALEHFAIEMSTIRGIRCSVSSRGSFENVSAEVGGHLFRIVQEATNNALRHGHAKRLRITLSRAGNSRRLTISDDGQGCDARKVLDREAGFGLRSMRARTEEIGGTFRLESRRGRGTRVRITWNEPRLRETTYTN